MNDLEKLLSALAGRSCTGALRDLMDAGFFTRVLPEVQTMKGVTQDFYHSDDVWEHTLKTMEVVERILEEPAEFIAGMDRVRGMINRYLDAGRRRTMIKLAVLLHDIGKPPTRSEEDGRILFWDHDRVGAEMLDGITARIGIPAEEHAFIRKIVGEHLILLRFRSEGIGMDEIKTRFFNGFGEDGVALLLLSLADLHARSLGEREEFIRNRAKSLVSEMIGWFYAGKKKS